jgi:hypothetical protein
MTEDQIECAVERKIDAIDARYMASKMTQAEYDAAIKAVNDWADREYRLAACPLG